MIQWTIHDSVDYPWFNRLSSHLILCHSLLLFAFNLSQHLSIFPVSWLFTSDGQSIEASASALPMSIQGWFPLRFTGLIFLLSKGLSRVFSNTTVQKHQFFSTQPSLWANSHLSMTTGKIIALTIWTFVNKVIPLVFNTLSRFVIAFFSRSKHLLISWLQLLSTGSVSLILKMKLRQRRAVQCYASSSYRTRMRTLVFMALVTDRCIHSKLVGTCPHAQVRPTSCFCTLLLGLHGDSVPLHLIEFCCSSKSSHYLCQFIYSSREHELVFSYLILHILLFLPMQEKNWKSWPGWEIWMALLEWFL